MLRKRKMIPLRQVRLETIQLRAKRKRRRRKRMRVTMMSLAI